MSVKTTQWQKGGMLYTQCSEEMQVIIETMFITYVTWSGFLVATVLLMLITLIKWDLNERSDNALGTETTPDRVSLGFHCQREGYFL